MGRSMPGHSSQSPEFERASRTLAPPDPSLDPDHIRYQIQLSWMRIFGPILTPRPIRRRRP